MDALMLNTIERRIGEIERKSEVEVVVALAAASSPYRLTTWAAVSIAVCAALLGMIYLPSMSFDPAYIPLDLLLLGLVVGCAVRWTRLLAWLTPRSLRRRAVETAAKLVFFDQNVSATRERVGLLLFYSALERELEIVPDHGIARRVAEELWNPLRMRRPERVEQVIEILDAVERVLVEHLPREGEGENELPNTPVVMGVIR